MQSVPSNMDVIFLLFLHKLLLEIYSQFGCSPLLASRESCVEFYVESYIRALKNILRKLSFLKSYYFTSKLKECFLLLNIQKHKKDVLKIFRSRYSMSCLSADSASKVRVKSDQSKDTDFLRHPSHVPVQSDAVVKLQFVFERYSIRFSAWQPIILGKVIVDFFVSSS